jgi:23S rRNA pseudouridine1911/1915/1917 synthase
MLHAWQLSFDHPVSGKKLHFTAPPPVDFKPWLDLKGR